MTAALTAALPHLAPHEPCDACFMVDAENIRKENESLRIELDAVLADWNEVVIASGSSTNGGLAGHVAALRADAERWQYVRINCGLVPSAFGSGQLALTLAGRTGTENAIALDKHIDTALRAKGDG